MHVTFLLTPDKFSAHFIRKQLSQERSLLGLQVGTWPELLELARTSYCLLNPDDNWREEIENAMAGISKAFWAESMAYDPETTVTMVTGALSELLWSMGAGQQLKAGRLTKRGEKQVSNFLQLHKKAGKIYPNDLSLIFYMADKLIHHRN